MRLRPYIVAAVLALLIVGSVGAAWGQLTGFTISTVANLPAVCTPGQPFIVTDGNAADDCSTGGGSTAVLCTCDAGGSTYSATGDGGGGSSEWTDSGAAGTLTPNESDDDVQEDASTPTWMLDAAGHIGTDTRLRVGDADADASSACLSVASDAIYHDTDCDGTKDAGEENVGQAGGSSNPDSISFYCKNCKTSDDGDMQYKVMAAATLSRVSCSTTSATANINIYERAENSPNSGTTGMLSSDLVCNSDTTADASTSFSDSVVAADSVIALGIKSETLGNNDAVRVFVDFTYD